MKKSLFLECSILLLLLPNLFYAQSSGRITGEIQDAAQKTVIGATISLLKGTDSTLIKITLTNDLGQFEFELLKLGDYKIAVTHLGSKKYMSSVISLNAENQNHSLPAIRLQASDATELGAVTIAAQKPFIERKIDRTVVNVDALISNAGITAWEVLEKSPGVITNEEGSITLKGKEGATVFIDDKPTYLSGADLMNYLKSLPSGTIDKIELMTNPPAKYEAAGNAGVINIKTKKYLMRGFNGGVSLSYGQGVLSKSNNSLNLNYRNHKINLFGNLGSSLFTNFNDLTIKRYFKNVDNQIFASFVQNSDIQRRHWNNILKLGFDYYASKNTTLGVVVNGFLKPSSKTIYNTGFLYKGVSQTDSIVIADNDEKELLKNGSVNFNMKHLFNNEGKEWTFDADYIQYSSENKQLYKNYTYNATNSLKQQYDIIGNLPMTIDIYAVKTDYEQPLKYGVKMEIGAKSSYIKTNNIANYSNKVDNITAPDYNLSNHFIYKENINSAYLNFNKEWNRFALQSGLRLENTIAKGHQLGNIQKPDSTFDRSYTNLFPTFYISYTLDTNKFHQLILDYGKRIDRPYFQELNPFISPLDKYTFYGGNPFLKPQYSHNIQLSHVYKGFWSTNLTYQFLQDIFAETIEIDVNNNYNYFSRPKNLAKRTLLSLSTNVTLKPVKTWTCITNAEITHLNYQGKPYTEKIDTAGTFVFLNVVNQFALGKGWNAELSGWYRSAITTSQVVTLPQGQISAGFQKKILQNKGNLKFNISDIFYTRINGGSINFLQRTESSYTNYMDTRVATLSFSYNFSKGAAAKGNRKTGGADEENNRVKN